MLRERRLLLSGLALPLLTGCAGFRGGWESVPYVGEVPPTFPESRTPFEAQRRRQLALSGLTLEIALHNTLRTHDTQVMLFVLPVSVDPRHVPAQPAEAGLTRVSITVTDLATDLSFRPRRAALAVGTNRVAGLGGHEFSQWDPQGRKVRSGGHWEDRPMPDEAVLSAQERAHVLRIDFPLPPPPPQARDITLDLSEALTAGSLPRLPLVRFVPVRWREGYS